jgi:hypothetical protein
MPRTDAPSPEERAQDLAASLFDGTVVTEKRLAAEIAAALREAEAAAEARGAAAARRDAREEAAGTFERLSEIVQTPANRVSDADKAFYSQVAELFEPLGRSILPNWTAIAAALRALAAQPDKETAR